VLYGLAGGEHGQDELGQQTVEEAAGEGGAAGDMAHAGLAGR
jgi:hypothetical protein